MKKYFAFCLFLLLGVSVCAVNANDFLIGAYSQYQIRYAGSNYADNFDSLGVYLKNAGYNATTYVLHSGYMSRQQDIFQKLHESNIKSMLCDDTWEPYNSKVGVGSLTFGNRLQIEAEYEFKTAIIDSEQVFVIDSLSTDNESNCMESYDYITKHEVGSLLNGVEHGYNLSNSHAWLCDSSLGHTAGKALSYPRKRWKLPWEDWPEKLSQDIAFFNAAIDDDSLYIAVAIQYENVAPGDPVASIDLKLYFPPPEYPRDLADDDPILYESEEASILQYVSIPLTPSYSSSDGTTIKNYPYPGVPTEPTGNMIYEFCVDLSSLRPYMTGSPNSSIRNFFHINPEIYWYGNGKLIIDYITIEDTYNRSVRLNQQNSYISHINNQITDLANIDTNSNLLYLMSVCEPRSGQLQMYKNMQNHLNSLNPARKMISAVWLKDYWITKHDGTPYNYHKRFLHETNPDRIMVDVYPLQGSIMWNGIGNTVQSKIDDMIHYNYYKLVRNIQQSNNPNTEIFHIPQIFGNVLEATGLWSYNMPPRSMVKALKFLPLCYASDGIVDFCIASNPSQVIEKGNWVTPLIHDRTGTYNQYNNLVITDHVSAFDMITTANSKIAKYGPIIRGLEWLNANKLMTTGMVPSPALDNEDMMPLNTMLLNNLYVDATPDNTGYTGYVQCGYYSDTTNNPYFMLVNRRAVYENDGTSSIPLKYVDLHFTDAAPQTVCFEPNNPDSHTAFGTHVALYDAYDNSIIQTNAGVINVPIGPGDGRLLQMCSSLPSSVTSNADVKKIAYLSGSITIDEEAIVTIHPGTITTVLPNTILRVTSGSTLNIAGEVTIMDNVSIIVEEGGQISFDGAVCTWGIGSLLEVTGGTLSITGGSMDKSDNTSRWAGIRASASSQVTINNASISNAIANMITDSDCLITDSSITIPANSVGLIIVNSIPGHTTTIINSLPNRGFYGSTDQSNVGISLGEMHNPLTISNVDFQNLNCGITKYAVPYATDSVSECRFLNCNTGIRLFNNENGADIQECSFASNQTGKQGTGIHLLASSPTISTSNFTNLYRGILTEYALLSGFGYQSSVNESNFYNCEMGIESRDSNHRLKGNYFNRNYSGIVNHAGSNLNLSYNANNVMMNRNDNIVFYDTMPYESTIQLFVGHNDFYHLTDNDAGISAVDFSFDTNYYDFPLSLDYKINASKNWFQEDQVTFNDPAYVDYVYVDVYDPSPNIPAPPPESDRLFTALEYEAQEMYELAGATYMAIIDDDLEEEQSYLTSAIDGLYRCTMMIPNPAWELSDYFDAEAMQCAIDDPTLSAILKDYLAKVFVLNEDFQAAVDLIQLRIDTPISTIDSLRAVLDLEIVLQIAAMNENKRPLTTKYVQYQYPDIQVFDAMHSNNWDKYNRLLHPNDPETSSLLAPVPQFQNNYPNPFNPSTTIAFSIPKDAKTKLSVYNIKGQKVKDIISGELQKGFHKAVWDGKDSSNRSVSSGIYIFRLVSDGKVSVRKAMLMK